MSPLCAAVCSGTNKEGDFLVNGGCVGKPHKISTFPQKGTISKVNFMFQPLIFRGYVSFRERRSVVSINHRRFHHF